VTAEDGHLATALEKHEFCFTVGGHKENCWHTGLVIHFKLVAVNEADLRFTDVLC